MSTDTPQTSRLAVALRHVTGGADWLVIAYVVLALILLGWCADGIREVLLYFVPDEQEHIAAGSLAALFFVLILPSCWWVLRKARKLRYRVESQAPRPVKALLVYLSVASATNDDIKQVSNLHDSALHRHPWRMPLLAINHHRSALREVVVIASSNQQESQGSLAQWPKFRDLITQLWPEHSWRLRLASELEPSLDAGVDFLELPALVEATDTVVRYLVEEGINGDQVLIDITGGTQLAGIAGAAVALEQRRRFQYISATPGQDDSQQIQVFASTYEME